jgi:hypothetical protein
MVGTRTIGFFAELRKRLAAEMEPKTFTKEGKPLRIREEGQSGKLRQ